MTWNLYCPRCGWEGESEEYYPYCPKCGGPLEIRGTLPRPTMTLGEGSTPLVKRGRNLYKLDYLNPTGSFKDRGASQSVSLAASLDYKCVVEDTSGNTGISVAAYGALYGLKTIIHAPRTISKGKASLIKSLGARLIVHDSRGVAAEAAARESSRCFYVAHSYSPVFIEGISSLAGELAEYAARTLILVPVSSGSLLLGLYRGLRRNGVNPRIIAVQAVEAASLAGKARVLASTRASTSKLADALVLRNPPRLSEMARAVDGVAIVGDPEIVEALDKLYKMGFIVEPSSAVVEAARSMLGLEAAILVLTGSGLKYACGHFVAGGEDY